MDIQQVIGRNRVLFVDAIARHERQISGARVLVFGGAGSIGKEVAAQTFRRNPAALHVIDISENNFVEFMVMAVLDPAFDVSRVFKGLPERSSLGQLDR